MDFYLFQQINQFAFRWVFLDGLAVFLAEYFEYFLVSGLLLFLAFGFRKHWLMVFQALISAVFARFVVVELIRWILPRARPFALPNFTSQNLGGFVENDVNLLAEHSASSAFPSGHAAFFFAIATVVWMYNRKAGVLFFVGAFLISISRVFVGLHWPTDILAGAVVGIFSGWLIYKVLRKKQTY